jgi:uncharacterized protein
MPARRPPHKDIERGVVSFFLPIQRPRSAAGTPLLMRYEYCFFLHNSSRCRAMPATCKDVARRVPESVQSILNRFLRRLRLARFGNHPVEVTRFSGVHVSAIRPIIASMKKPCTAGTAMNLLRPLLIAALMLTHPLAHAASFDCNKGRSLTEKMICHDPALSKLDDTLGQLYWKARRRVANRRAFLTDSDSKWAWREANCRDSACLGTWYATRIEELQQLIESLQAGTPQPFASPAEPDSRSRPVVAPEQSTGMAMLQCTAANPGIVVNEQCSAVLTENGSQWKHKPHDGGWFCGVATLAPAELQADAAN